MLSVFSVGDKVQIGYADRLGEVICLGQHLLERDLFEGISVQSVAHVCMWSAALQLSGLHLNHRCLAASLLL